MLTTLSTTGARPGSRRADEILLQQRLRAPARIANAARNARAEVDRHSRWAPARDAVWQLLEPLLHSSTRVAIVGAGNGDDLPLSRLAGHVQELSLIDVDPRASRTARRRQPRRIRGRINVIEHDVTHGAADQIAIAAAQGEVPVAPLIPESPLPDAPYDLVIGDLLYSQLLYPALCDLDVASVRTTAVLARYSPSLTRSVVARLHSSAPHGRVVHIHDPVGWWPGHSQPFTLAQTLAIAEVHPDAAVRLARRAAGPHHSDPRSALTAFGIPVRATSFWRWPFASDVDYLACATIA
jgi:hypothetical protein